MIVTKAELTETRTKLLKDMDSYVRHNIGNDIISVDIWHATGVPEDPEEIDFQRIAEDDELWLLAVKTFAKCCKFEGEC